MRVNSEAKDVYRPFSEVARDNEQCAIRNEVVSQQNHCAIDECDVMKPAGQERMSAGCCVVPDMRRSHVYGQHGQERQRERKRWNENNAAFPNKSGTVHTNATQKSRRNRNSLRKEIKKHVHHITIICYGSIRVNMTRNEGKASDTSTSTQKHNTITVHVELTT